MPAWLEQQLASDQEPTSALLSLFTSEEANPVYAATQQALVAAASDDKGLTAKLQAATAAENRLTSAIAQLSQELAPLQDRQAALDRTLERQRATLAFLQQSYSDSQQRQLPLAGQIAEAAQSQREKQTSLLSLKDEIALLSARLLQDTDALEQLQREVTVKEQQRPLRNCSRQ